MQEKYIINGGKPLYGSVRIGGAKNAAVAILPAVLLSDEICIIDNLPAISDVEGILSALCHLGAKIKRLSPHRVEIDPRHVNTFMVNPEIARGMRASSYFLGALLGRFGRARVALPGGCYFGARPIDQHIKGFEILGSHVSVEDGMIDAQALALFGGTIYIDMVSVGATVNIMLAATKAKGLTIIENAAREPHIVDLANFLNSMGANIMGAGTPVIKIMGVEHLHGAEYSIIPDQIEAGTFLTAAAATRGDIQIENVTPQHLESILAKLREAGAVIEQGDESVHLIMRERPRACKVKTLPHPGFPTDMQPQIATLLSVATGNSTVTEGIWDNRFRYVNELLNMGANIQVDGKSAYIIGVPQLKAAKVTAMDLRAGAAMIIAGLMANGRTEISDIHHINRGYELVCEKFNSLGASIKRSIKPDDISIIA